MALHEQSVGKSDEWYTPRFVFDALGETFDLDVAHPGAGALTFYGQPVDWVPAAQVISHDSLALPWTGFLWMNAPFGRRMGLVPWLERFMAHADGIALTPDRTSCPWWQRFSRDADAVLFWAPKIKFVPGPNTVESSPAQGTTLFAKGPRGVEALRRAARGGHGVVLAP